MVTCRALAITFTLVLQSIADSATPMEVYLGLDARLIHIDDCINETMPVLNYIINQDLVKWLSAKGDFVAQAVLSGYNGAPMQRWRNWTDTGKMRVNATDCIHNTNQYSFNESDVVGLLDVTDWLTNAAGSVEAHVDVVALVIVDSTVSNLTLQTIINTFSSAKFGTNVQWLVFTVHRSASSRPTRPQAQLCPCYPVGCGCGMSDTFVSTAATTLQPASESRDRCSPGSSTLDSSCLNVKVNTTTEDDDEESSATPTPTADPTARLILIVTLGTVGGLMLICTVLCVVKMRKEAKKTNSELNASVSAAGELSSTSHALPLPEAHKHHSNTKLKDIPSLTGSLSMSESEKQRIKRGEAKSVTPQLKLSPSIKNMRGSKDKASVASLSASTTDETTEQELAKLSPYLRNLYLSQGIEPASSKKFPSVVHRPITSQSPIPAISTRVALVSTTATTPNDMKSFDHDAPGGTSSDPGTKTESFHEV